MYDLNDMFVFIINMFEKFEISFNYWYEILV